MTWLKCKVFVFVIILFNLFCHLKLRFHKKKKKKKEKTSRSYFQRQKSFFCMTSEKYYSNGQPCHDSIKFWQLWLSCAKALFVRKTNSKKKKTTTGSRIYLLRSSELVKNWIWAASWQNQQNGIVRSEKSQISLGIRQVWSESSLTAWRKPGSLATHWTHNKDTDQTGWIAQADLSLRWAHMPFCCFCREAAHILFAICWYIVIQDRLDISNILL